MDKPKVLFVYDHKYPDKWMDGLWAALRLLEKDFTIIRYNLHDNSFVPLGDDFIFRLGWGAFNSSVDRFCQQLPFKKGLCIAGNSFPPEGADKYDVLFYETKWYRPQINFHKNIVHAFGINTDIYNSHSLQVPNLKLAIPIIFDYIGVGSFALWKRWDKMKNKKGQRLIVGEYQLNNEPESLSIITDLIKNNITISNMVHPFDLSNLYSWARTCYIPADINGGGERAVLEARACGCKVEVEDDNPKLKELTESPIWDHKYYAEQLKYGILSVI